jgi:hypothetical protein
MPLDTAIPFLYPNKCYIISIAGYDGKSRRAGRHREAGVGATGPESPLKIVPEPPVEQ